MKKLIIALSIGMLTVSAYAMSNAPAGASACGTDKACVKEAACDMKKAASCDAEKAAACNIKKTAEEKAACVGGVCPMPATK